MEIIKELEKYIQELQTKIVDLEQENKCLKAENEEPNIDCTRITREDKKDFLINRSMQGKLINESKLYEFVVDNLSTTQKEAYQDIIINYTFKKSGINLKNSLSLMINGTFTLSLDWGHFSNEQLNYYIESLYPIIPIKRK